MTLEEIPRDRVGGSTGRANVLHRQREEDIGLILGRLGPGALEGRAVAREVVLQPGLGADAPVSLAARRLRVVPAVAAVRTAAAAPRPRSPGAPSKRRRGGASSREARAGRSLMPHRQATARSGRPTRPSRPRWPCASRSMAGGSRRRQSSAAPDDGADGRWTSRTAFLRSCSCRLLILILGRRGAKRAEKEQSDARRRAG